MNITPKYNYASTVWYIANNQVLNSMVLDTFIRIKGAGQVLNIKYTLSTKEGVSAQIDEDKLFKTKQELLNSL